MPELAWEAVKEAFDDARVGPEDIQGFVVGNVGSWSSETLPVVVVSEYCGLVPKSGIRVEAACATGSATVRTAYHMVVSGEADIVMAVGVEKMNESPTPTVTIATFLIM